MSCDWDIWCQDCDESLGISDANRADNVMRALVSKKDALADLGDLLAGPDVYEMVLVTNISIHVHLNFFAAHRGHHLRPQNEYGEFDVPCTAVFVCARGCGEVACSRSMNHHGPDDHWHVSPENEHSVHWSKSKENS